MTGRFLDSRFVRVWTQPRQVIWDVLRDDPAGHNHLLMMLSGAVNFLDRAMITGIGETISKSSIALFCLLVGPLFGLAYLYMGGALLTWTGSWFGGKGTQMEVRAACAWGSVPAIWEFLIWPFVLLYIGDEIFLKNPSTLSALPLFWNLFCWSAVVALFFWEFVVELECLAEAHRFSVWKALAASVVTRILLVFCWVIPTAMMVLAAKVVGIFLSTLF